MPLPTKHLLDHLLLSVTPVSEVKKYIDNHINYVVLLCNYGRYINKNNPIVWVLGNFIFQFEWNFSGSVTK